MREVKLLLFVGTKILKFIENVPYNLHNLTQCFEYISTKTVFATGFLVSLRPCLEKEKERPRLPALPLVQPQRNLVRRLRKKRRTLTSTPTPAPTLTTPTTTTTPPTTTTTPTTTPTTISTILRSCVVMYVLTCIQTQRCCNVFIHIVVVALMGYGSTVIIGTSLAPNADILRR